MYPHVTGSAVRVSDRGFKSGQHTCAGALSGLMMTAWSLSLRSEYAESPGLLRTRRQ